MELTEPDDHHVCTAEATVDEEGKGVIKVDLEDEELGDELVDAPKPQSQLVPEGTYASATKRKVLRFEGPEEAAQVKGRELLQLVKNRAELDLKISEQACRTPARYMAWVNQPLTVMIRSAPNGSGDLTTEHAFPPTIFFQKRMACKVLYVSGADYTRLLLRPRAGRLRREYLAIMGCEPHGEPRRKAVGKLRTTCRVLAGTMVQSTFWN